MTVRVNDRGPFVPGRVVDRIRVGDDLARTGHDGKLEIEVAGGHSCSQNIGNARLKRRVGRHEVGVAPVAFWPGAVERESSCERTFIKRNAGDDGDIFFSAGGEKFVLGILVEDVVDDLDGVEPAVSHQLDQRVLLLANTLSDAAAGHIVGGNLLALHALARKYTLLDGVAFAFIENSKGEVIVHTLGAFPPELQQGLPITGQRQTYRRELSLSGRAVYETGVPILEGQLGAVHVGFWVDAAEKEIQRTLLPVTGSPLISSVPSSG